MGRSNKKKEKINSDIEKLEVLSSIYMDLSAAVDSLHAWLSKILYFNQVIAYISDFPGYH